MTSRQKNGKKLNSQSIEIEKNSLKHGQRENIGVIVGTKYKGLDINKNEQKQKKRSANMTKDDIDKFQNVLSSEPKSKLSRYEEGRESAVKVYERQDKYHVIDRLTFGPQNFRKKDNMSGSKIQKESNPEQILPITHKKVTKSRSSTKPSVLQEPKINSKVYQIMNKELGMSNSAILKLKQETLNYELQKFVKKKGKQYLQQNHEKNKRRKTQQPIKQYGNIEIVLIDSENKKKKEKQKSRQKLDKYPNYIPEVFPKIVRKSSEKKAILSEAGKSDKLKTVQKLKIKSKKELKIDNLNDKQEILGKIVYDKVQDYFKLNQQKANYFSRVKSEQKIDEAWIQYLKTKVDRADLILKQKS